MESQIIESQIDEEKEEEIIDDSVIDETVAPIQYDITSYGSDMPIDGLVKRLRRGDIYIPSFQRDYVWSHSEASRLIESLLLGLPVPGIFLAKDDDTNKLLVIDGQQRLKSIQFFYDGFFNPKTGQKTKRVFKLINVQERFRDTTYESLSEADRRFLDDAIIHAIVIKQESPTDDNTAIYHVFERLNTGGKKLTPQEIRTAVYHGPFNDFINELNDFHLWRDMFGPKSPRLKDIELVLRFLAVLNQSANYAKPMNEFLNRFSKQNRHSISTQLIADSVLFKQSIEFLHTCIGKNAFRPDRVFNVSVFEALTICVARMISGGVAINCEKFQQDHQSLINNEEFKTSVTRATSDETVFKSRHELAELFLKQ